jgi:hypothetical protein
MHAVPFAPHAVATVGDWQVFPTQHPAHCAAQLEHAPLWHVSAPGHAEQAPPPTPHIAGSVPVAHVAPLQHPVAHDAGVQTHAPPTHA